MKNILNEISTLLEAIPKSSIKSKLIDAIENRHPVSFYYNGPKGEVLPGRRIKAELVTMGLTKKGNPAVRGWVEPPSVSKKGFGASKNTPEYGWRLFILPRMSGINIYEDETFNQKRPGYNESGDNSLTSIEAKVNWGEVPQPKAVEKPKPITQKPKTELPQPKPKQKPSATPQPEIKRDVEVYNDLKNKVNDKKQVSPNDVKSSLDTLYKKKIEDWVKSQKEVGGNTNPGEGTRRKFEKDAETELYSLLKKDNITVTEPSTETGGENEETPLTESIKRMKALIFF